MKLERRRRPAASLFAVFVLTGFHSVIAQEREGARSAESQVDKRTSPEASANRTQPDLRGSRDQRTAETESPVPDKLQGFRPRTSREAALVKMIIELQQELAEVRSELEKVKRVTVTAETKSDPPKDGQESDGSNAAVDGFANSFSLPDRWQNSKEGRVFRAYDRNADQVVSLNEWLVMTNGNINAERRALQTRRFYDAEPSGDGRFTPAEFIWWYSIGRRNAIEGGRRSSDRE
ncbi:MAG: hypothetical protein AAGI63_12425 [Planctomycetota bacterium]